MSSCAAQSISSASSALKRTHSWPPSQWYLDRIADELESPILSHEAAIQELSDLSPASRSALAYSHADTDAPSEILPTVPSDHDSESSSVRAASHKAVAGDIGNITPRGGSLYFGSTSNLALVPQRSPFTEKKASFRRKYIKRWSRDMSKTTKKAAKQLFTRKSRERSNSDDIKQGSFETSPVPQPEPEIEPIARPRGRSRSRLRHSSHEMSLEDGISPLSLDVPVPMRIPDRYAHLLSPLIAVCSEHTSCECLEPYAVSLGVPVTDL